MSGTSNAPASLLVLREEIDREATMLARVHAERLRCRRGCHDCCIDGLTVFTVEADAIRDAFPELTATGTPHPAGACAFLDSEGACRVYAVRPYVCRTQGLPLRWIAEKNGETVEYRDICPLNEAGGPDLTDLAEDECWSLGPFEGRLAALQERHGEKGQRVSLRSLFRRR